LDYFIIQHKTSMKKNKKILITGITGQDGLFLVKELLQNNSKLEVYGVSRDSDTKTFYSNLAYLNNDIDKNNIKILNIEMKNKEKVTTLISDLNPNYIYNLSGPSSVYDSITNPSLGEEIVTIFNNIVDACVDTKIFPNFFQASSSEMYGKNTSIILNEDSTFMPNSPYGNAKLKNHKEVSSLRKKYDWNIVSGIMFNHESEFRKNSYLFMKIINYLIDKDNLANKKLVLGGLDLKRDWSYAEDFVKGIVSMVNSFLLEDFVLGSGKSTSIKTVVEIAFSFFNLDWNDFVEIDNTILRNEDPNNRVSDPGKIKKYLNWEAQTGIEEIVEKIIKFKLS